MSSVRGKNIKSSLCWMWYYSRNLSLLQRGAGHVTSFQALYISEAAGEKWTLRSAADLKPFHLFQRQTHSCEHGCHHQSLYQSYWYVWQLDSEHLSSLNCFPPCHNLKLANGHFPYHNFLLLITWMCVYCLLWPCQWLPSLMDAVISP